MSLVSPRSTYGIGDREGARAGWDSMRFRADALSDVQIQIFANLSVLRLHSKRFERAKLFALVRFRALALRAKHKSATFSSISPSTKDFHDNDHNYRSSRFKGGGGGGSFSPRCGRVTAKRGAISLEATRAQRERDETLV